MNGRSLEAKLIKQIDAKLSELFQLYKAAIIPTRITIFDEFWKNANPDPNSFVSIEDLNWHYDRIRSSIKATNYSATNRFQGLLLKLLDVCHVLSVKKYALNKIIQIIRNCNLSSLQEIVYLVQFITQLKTDKKPDIDSLVKAQAELDSLQLIFRLLGYKLCQTKGQIFIKTNKNWGFSNNKSSIHIRNSIFKFPSTEEINKYRERILSKENTSATDKNISADYLNDFGSYVLEMQDFVTKLQSDIDEETKVTDGEVYVLQNHDWLCTLKGYIKLITADQFDCSGRIISYDSMLLELSIATRSQSSWNSFSGIVPTNWSVADNASTSLKDILVQFKEYDVNTKLLPEIEKYEKYKSHAEEKFVKNTELKHKISKQLNALKTFGAPLNTHIKKTNKHINDIKFVERNNSISGFFKNYWLPISIITISATAIATAVTVLCLASPILIAGIILTSAIFGLLGGIAIGLVHAYIKRNKLASSILYSEEKEDKIIGAISSVVGMTIIQKANQDTVFSDQPRVAIRVQ